VLVGANKRVLGLLGAIRSICKITETVLVLPMPLRLQIRCTQDFSKYLVAEMLGVKAYARSMKMFQFYLFQVGPKLEVEKIYQGI